MKNPFQNLLVIFLLVVIVCLLCVRPAHAEIVDYTVGATPFLTGNAGQSIYVPSVPGVTVSPTTAATATNPYGYVPKLISGAPVLEASVPLRLTPPVGAVPSAATITAAAGMAGGLGTDIGNLIKTVPLGSGSGSLAVSLAKGALGVGTVAAGVMGSPVLLGALMTASVGMAGYDFYQSLKAQGVTGSGSTPGQILYDVPHPLNTSSFNGYGGKTPDAYCASQTQWDACHHVGWWYQNNTMFQCANSGGAACAGGGPFGPVSAQCVSGATLSGGVCVCPAGKQFNSAGTSCVAATTPAPVSESQFNAAVIAATLAATAAVDAAKFAINNNVPLPAGMPAGSPSMELKSPFAEVSSSTDSLGNTVKTLERNVMNIAPGVAGAAPVADMQKQTVTVTNATPTSVTSASIAPAIAAATDAANQLKLSDLCVQHPDILACADVSKLNDLPVVTPLTSEKNISSLTPVTLGAGMVVCPPPLALPGMFGGPVMYLDIWHYPCQFADRIKPITIAAAGMASLFILMGAFKNG